MPTIYGALNPPAAATYAGSAILNGTAIGADGDVFVRLSGVNPQWRFSVNPAPVWTPIVPPTAGSPRIVASDTRADSVPRGGGANERLAKVGVAAANVTAAQPWALGWSPAAGGVVGPGDEGVFEQLTPLAVWDVLHGLGKEIVDVTVVDVDGDTIHVPTIEYATEQNCRLHFQHPVAGRAIVRR